MLRATLKKTILRRGTLLRRGQKHRFSTKPPRGPLATTKNRPRRAPEPPDGYNRSPDPCAINTPTGAATP